MTEPRIDLRLDEGIARQQRRVFSQILDNGIRLREGSTIVEFDYWHLAGGIDAWARLMEPDMPRY